MATAVMPGSDVPAQITMGGTPMAKTFMSGFQMTHPNGGTYTWQPMPNKSWKDLVPLLCPIGPGGAKYTSDAGANFIVKNKCRPFCPWTVVDDDDKVLAKAAKPGMCTNGPLFCCCPLFLMAGKAKTFMILNGQGAEVLTLQQSLYPCWTIISCEGVALFLGAVADCKEFASGSVMKTIRQPVYGPQEKALSSTSEQFGVMEVTYVNKPQSMCTASAFTQVKCEFVPREGFVPTPDQEAALGLLIMLYKGQTIKDRITTPGVLFPVPKGNAFADKGLGSSFEYHKLEEVKMHFIKEFKHVVDSNPNAGPSIKTKNND